MKKTAYLRWLMVQCQINADGPDGYLHLCEILQGTYFVSLVEFDENRADEGRHLRNEWADTDGDIHELEDELIPYTCTMLELLLVMARRMAYEMMDSQFEAETVSRNDRIRKAAEMLENAGLAYFRNDIFEAEPQYSERQIKAILGSIVYRRYDQKGNGGFFPCENPRTDQRSTELLIQMNNYLEENYDIC